MGHEELKQSENSDPRTMSWNLLLNIKTAGKIKRLASLNHEIDYLLREHGTVAKVSLKNLGYNDLGRDFVLYFQHDKMFEPSVFSQFNEFGEQSFLFNYLPIIKNPKQRDQFFLKLSQINDGKIDTCRNLKYEDLTKGKNMND